MKSNWQKRKLADVCELINGRAYSKPELLAEGKYPVLRVGNFFTNNHWYYSDLELETKKYCDTGDLLYAWSASFGPRIWTGGKVIFHYHIWKVVPAPALIDQKFLYYFFLWDTEQIKEDSGAGTTMLHVSKGSMEDRNILVPPLPEQHRIVAILDEAFDSIATAKANAEKNLQNARALFESHLQSVFTERGEGWVEKKLDEVTNLITCGVAKRPDYVPEGIPFLSAKNVKNGQVIWSGHQYVSEETHLALTKNNKPLKGDILYTRVGSYGEAAIVDRDEEFSIFVSLTLIKPKSIVLNSFLKHYLNSSATKTLAAKSISGSGVGNLNVGTVREFPISLPTIDQQRSIVAKIDDLRAETQRLASLYQQKLTALDDLKKSLLHQAFSGQL
jgi:type I restriction enzyme S subunit